MISFEKSEAAFREAANYIPGGVNSPVRAYGSVGGRPPFIASGRGSHITDIDGNEYVDYVCSWGPLILGHAHERVISAVTEAAKKGTSFGAPTEIETRLAKLVVDNVPAVDRVRFVNSGTEAVMSAVRLARGYTKREVIVNFEGCYHGHSDSLLVKAGSGVMTLGTPGSPGVTEGTVKDTLTLQYNDIPAFRELMDARGDEVACVLVEPIAGNMGVVPPADGFLKALREETKKHGALLLFDEVITGFRVGPGGAQKLFGINPDLTTLGKIVGGGFPAAAYGGREDIMGSMAPEGPVYQAGTLSGNPVAMAAGAATLEAVLEDGFYEKLEKKGARLENGLAGVFEDAGIQVTMNRFGSMSTVFFTPGPVVDHSTSAASDNETFLKWHRGMLERGVYLAPSRFEAAFISSEHTEEDIDRTVEAAREVVKAL